MKKNLLFIMAFAMVSMPLFAKHVDNKTAQKVAENFIQSKTGQKASLSIIELSVQNRLSNIYIYGNDHCFVIVSADDCVRPILGYSTESPCPTAMLPDNIASWLSDYDAQIAACAKNSTSQSAEFRNEWQCLAEGKTPSTRSEIIVPPLIKTQWDQDSPYYNLCPKDGTARCYTGCVATAMAQVMNYWKYPQQGNGSHSYTWNGQTLSADFGNTTYQWEKMANTYSSSSSQESKSAVATLMFHCGVSVDMDYGTSGSGAFSSDVPKALTNYFDYATSATIRKREDYSDEAWKDILKQELNASRPIFYSGRSVESGHAFVCDGYRDDDYFHFNWGWSGNCDGYFMIDHLAPGSGGSGSGAGSYNLNNSVITFIEPRNGLQIPEVTATADENSIIIQWNPISYAHHYELYKNGILIQANLSTNQYHDTDVDFGIQYEYFVKAIDGNNIASNASNIVIARVTYHDPKPTALTADIAGNDISLSWTAPEKKSIEMFYGKEAEGGLGFGGAFEVWWGQKYPSSLLRSFAGMEVSSISYYSFYEGNYKVLFFNESTQSEQNKIYEMSFTTTQEGWNDINIDSSVVIDGSKDLWVILYADTDIAYPMSFGQYIGEDYKNAGYFTDDLSYMYPLYIMGEEYRHLSWAMSFTLTDGDFTYDIYRDNALIAKNHTATSYLDQHLPGGSYSYYVKTDSNGHLSSASDTITATVSNSHIITTDVVINDDLNLNEYERYLITKNGKLTINGAVTCSDPHSLVLEDGAQLIHGNQGVMATAKKDISGYGEGNGNWHLIASPLADTLSAAYLTNGTYDLYLYNEPTHYWWNSQFSPGHEDHHFNVLSNGEGYLYANKEDYQFEMCGELQPSSIPVTLNLSYTPSLNELRGLNLIGNPFPCKAVVNGDIASDFFVMNESGTGLILSDNAIISPNEGIFVQALAPNSTATISRYDGSTREDTDKPTLDITLSAGQAIIDRVRIHFEEGYNLDKFSIDDNESKLYVANGGNGYASFHATTKEDGEIPINFEAVRNGEYKVSTHANNVDLTYLHLIDNISGADIDLLSSIITDYSFIANISDYKHRFKLAFKHTQKPDNHDLFISYSNGQLFIPELEAASWICVVDASGRIMMNEETKGNCIVPISLPAGVYIVNLTIAEKSQSQKIVVE